MLKNDVPWLSSAAMLASIRAAESASTALVYVQHSKTRAVINHSCTCLFLTAMTLLVHSLVCLIHTLGFIIN